MSSLLAPTIPEPFSPDNDFKVFLKNHCQYLTKGTSRKVYLINDSNFILKVACRKNTIVCNWTEISAYHWVQDKSTLAKVSSWSDSGRYLIMEKLDMTKEQKNSFSWPSWVTDQKPTNLGKDKFGNWKICDFASVKIKILPSSSTFA